MKLESTLLIAFIIGTPLIIIIIAIIKLKIPLMMANAIDNLIGLIESIAVKPFSSRRFKTIPLPFFAIKL